MVAYPKCNIALSAIKPCKSGYIPNPVTLGEHIRKVRMDKNLYQKDVASIIGVSEDCIVGWENNRSNPQIRYMPAIIKFLGYTPELNSDLDEISKKIKNLRNQKGMKLRDLAKEIRIDERTLSNVEKGKGRILERTRARIVSFINKIQS